MEICSYPKIWNLGHPQLAELLLDDVIVEEKVDGSQFSMMRTLQGELVCRSKGAGIVVDGPDKMFAAGVAVAKELPLVPGWVYRGEYLRSPKHNTLSYSRIPRNHIALFDVMTGPETYVAAEDKAIIADALGLEVVPLLFTGRIDSPDQLQEFMQQTSFLGGCKLEGVVIKNYKRFCRDGKVMLGKHVSEDFKEIHKTSWTKENPTNKDILTILAAKVQSPARWAKTVHRLRDAGALQNAPQDIGPLLKELHHDIDVETREEMAEVLLKWAMPHVKRAAARGFPEWYKERLMKLQFEADGGELTRDLHLPPDATP
jgi:hypothetical protein